MGTINHKTSDYITLASPDYDYRDFTDDNEITDYDAIQDCIDADRENVKWLLDNKYGGIDKYGHVCGFYYYHITIEPGYYDGFSIQIENNFPICYDWYEEKLEAQKEITQIKNFLIDCANVGMVQIFPGWCTNYKSHAETIAGIKEAIKEMREEVKAIPTWTQYNRAETA